MTILLEQDNDNDKYDNDAGEQTVVSNRVSAAN